MKRLINGARAINLGCSHLDVSTALSRAKLALVVEVPTGQSMMQIGVLVDVGPIVIGRDNSAALTATLSTLLFGESSCFEELQFSYKFLLLVRCKSLLRERLLSTALD